jgi:hypothetical protein
VAVGWVWCVAAGSAGCVAMRRGCWLYCVVLCMPWTWHGCPLSPPTYDRRLCEWLAGADTSAAHMAQPACMRNTANPSNIAPTSLGCSSSGWVSRRLAARLGCIAEAASLQGEPLWAAWFFFIAVFPEMPPLAAAVKYWEGVSALSAASRSNPVGVALA